MRKKIIGQHKGKGMDYRQSHKAPEKGKRYHELFQNKNFTRIVWEWEQDQLDSIFTERFDQQDKIKYLDFACGTGRIIRFFENKGNINSAVGVDVSISMIEEAKKHTKSKIIVADITREKIFPDNNFDFITAFRFFLNAQESLKQEAMSALAQLLCENGILVFNIHMQEGSLYDIVAKVYNYFKRQKPTYNTVKLADIYKLTEINKLEIKTIYHFGLIPLRYEKNISTLYNVLKYIEGMFSKISFLQPVSRNLIIVCKKKK